ncbi:glycine cleavage system protein GcvH [Opitutales bacterium]|nr:glycine cleavage system protein GcvH [Opitutales bacterium]
MSIPNELKYTSDHEWVRIEGEDFVIGITDHAQDSLGDVTFVELPDIGARFEDKAVFGVVESVKAASDLYMPVTGEIIEVNDSLNDSPEKVNSDPYGNGWMIKIRPDQADSIGSLLDADAYSTEIGD